MTIFAGVFLQAIAINYQRFAANLGQIERF